MDYISIILIAIGLAMDCLAVSISKGIVLKKIYWSYTLRMAIMFGLFQGCMPLIGFFAGISFADTISSVDHWIAFGLLAFIGGKMIWESASEREKGDGDAISESALLPKVQIGWKIVLSLALSTSIDDLATGVIFVPYPQRVCMAIFIIAFVSFLFSLIGMFIGVACGKCFNVNVNLLGGLILIGIGIKILTEHLFFQ